MGHVGHGSSVSSDCMQTRDVVLTFLSVFPSVGPPRCNIVSIKTIARISSNIYTVWYRGIILVFERYRRYKMRALNLRRWEKILTLKLVSESRVTWATSMPILVFQPLCSRVRPDVHDGQTSHRQTSACSFKSIIMVLI